MTNTKISIDRKRREDRVVLLWGAFTSLSLLCIPAYPVAARRRALCGAFRFRQREIG